MKALSLPGNTYVFASRYLGFRLPISRLPIDYILESIQTIYGIHHKNGAIRRVNVNIAATTVENYRKLKDTGIGTYILF